MESKKIKVSTFCSGIGSPEVAIKNLGIEHEVVLTAEIDKYARQTYLANHSTKKMINDMTVPDYEGEEYYADINISGLPCQSFSLAGKRLGELDPRGLLFFDFYRYVKNQMPKYFIIENVKGLLSDNNGATFQNWINLLGQSVNGDQFMFPHEDSLMYNLHWQVLNTKDYGLPQNRERVFLIGIRNDLPNSFVFPKGVPLKLRLKDILEDEVDEKYYLSDENISALIDYNKRQIENGRGFSAKFRDVEDVEIMDCLKVGGGGKDDLVKIKSATASGYEIETEGDSINMEHPNSETRRGRVGKQVAQTLTTSCNHGVMIGAMRGRYDESGKANQELEIKDDNISNTLTSVQKDNLVIQINPSTESGGVQPYQQNRVYDSEGIAPALCRGKSDLNVTEIIQLNNPTHSNDRVYSDEGISPTLNTMQGGNRQPFIQNDYRIRKLTPLECFRLQGFPDEFLQKAVDAGVSNSQLYKQAGNSISVPVIQAILKNLLKDYIEE